MFSIEIQDEFTAVHAVEIPGGKAWNRPIVTDGDWVFLTRDPLDAYGMVVDFHLIKRYLREILDPLENRDLNVTLALGHPPTAERIARHLFDRLAARVTSSGVRVQSVALCETDGCWAWYAS